MEKVDKDPKKERGRSVLPKNQKAKTGLSTQKAEKNPNEEDTKQPKREEEQERTKRIINLQRETTTTVNKIQTAGDAKLLGHRADLEEARRIRHFAAVDARRFQDEQQMAEEERKHQVEKILANNAQICKHLGIPWKPPDLPFLERPAPIQPQKQALKSDLPMETVKKLMEQLCDEMGFLMEDKFQQLLAPLDKEDQTIVKLYTIFQSLGIEDVPELADFLLKYKEEQEVQTEDVCAESSDGAKTAEISKNTNMSSKVIHPCSLLPGLNRFLEQRMDYSALLKEIPELRAQDERLQRRQTELRLLVQQKSNSRVSGTPEK